jgi:ABC-type nitrate/sulfonate/bicarbonate transport system permease component
VIAGSAGHGSGLAYRILESGYRLDIARMFATPLLISATGSVRSSTWPCMGAMGSTSAPRFT